MDDNREKVILESFRQAELFSQAQMSIALAADGRAMTFCGLCIAAASLLLGLDGSDEIKVGMYAASAVLYAAAAIAGWRGLPVDWYAPGQKGGDFAEDVATGRPYIDVISEMITQSDRHLSQNSQRLAKSGWWLRMSAYLAVSAPLVGAAVQVIVWIWF
ncbi:hypothetical protein D2T31_12055 [Sinirhodobacter populi]|uniref:Uncharacterized protein n=1 Tax=Paenirhodobacter populi TaxID=2306993 RepID=A0A443K7R8_9RHOB|nr:hypothetical protein [Sinirhodobacter populi]RWR28839.1 hypothetical protein D2T31_12055 [Sinirhodobacter populi]